MYGSLIDIPASSLITKHDPYPEVRLCAAGKCSAVSKREAPHSPALQSRMINGHPRLFDSDRQSHNLRKPPSCTLSVPSCPLRSFSYRIHLGLAHGVEMSRKRESAKCVRFLLHF